MKKTLFLSLLITVFCLNMQGQIAFPQDFKLDSRLLEGMVLAKIPEEYHSEGITDNPAVSQDPSVIRMMSDLDNEHIVQIYYEIYQSIENKHGDAGVIVSEFVSKEALLDCLPNLKIQSNLRYLTKDNYLIQIWSDSSKNRKTQMDNMSNYYLNKLQAELYEGAENEKDDDYLYETEAATEASEYSEPLEISVVEEAVEE